MIGSRPPRAPRDDRLAVANLLQIKEIFGDELSESVPFRDLLIDQIAEARALSQR